MILYFLVIPVPLETQSFIIRNQVLFPRTPDFIITFSCHTHHSVLYLYYFDTFVFKTLQNYHVCSRTLIARHGSDLLHVIGYCPTRHASLSNILISGGWRLLLAIRNKVFILQVNPRCWNGSLQVGEPKAWTRNYKPSPNSFYYDRCFTQHIHNSTIQILQFLLILSLAGRLMLLFCINIFLLFIVSMQVNQWSSAEYSKEHWRVALSIRYNDVVAWITRSLMALFADILLWK
jgi:hypothetical protein